MTTELTHAGVCNMPAYPLSVLRGCATVDELEAFREMPDGYLRVLLRLVKKIDVCSPTKPIFARRDTLATESGKSCETVGRALRWLEDHGFINRIQVTRKFLRGSDSHIHPTKKLIESLGFGHQKTMPNEQASNTPPVKNDRSLSALHKSINIHKQSHEPVDKSASPAKPKSSIRFNGKTVPSDLAWLVEENRLKVTAVLCLMKLAKKGGKLLSDIVVVSREYLNRLHGHGLFAYIRTLIQQNKDFKFIREQEEAKNKVEQTTQQHHELLARKAQEWSGRVFRERTGDKTYQVRREGFIDVMQGGKFLVSYNLDLKFLEAFEAGSLRIVQP
jgi:CTP-dependent riboflavin kinase